LRNDYALSFQEAKGAFNQWFSICFLKGLEPVNSGNNDQGEEENDQNECFIEDVLPQPSFYNLDQILDDLRNSDPYQRRKISLLITQDAMNSK